MLSPFPFVGRPREQAELLAHLQATADGQGRLVLLGGEAGAGKTALLRTLEPNLGTAIRATGRCPGPGETPPYGPWLEIVSRLRTDPGPAPDSLPPPFGSMHGQWSPYELAGVLGHWLGARGRPLALVLEDIHWSDAASLDLLRHLAPRLAEWPVLAIATYRTDELSRTHPLWPLLPELLRAGAVRMLLDRLTRSDVAELVARLLSPELQTPAVAQLVHARTAGLALFVREILEAAARTGEMPRAGAPMPQTLQQAIDSKLDRLPQAAQAILEPAAVIGERFALDLLGAVTDVDEDSLTGALEIAIARGLVSAQDADGHRFAFAHALVREALLGRMIGSRRRRLHARIADTLARGRAPDVEELAFHLYRAGDPRAAEQLAVAGDRARALGAVAQARERYEQALGILPPSHPRRVEVMLKLGFAVRWGEPARAGALWQEALAAAEASGDEAAAVWARYLLLLLAVEQNEPGLLEQVAGVRSPQERLVDDPRYRQLEIGLFGSPAGYPLAETLLIRTLIKGGALDEAGKRLQALSDRAQTGASHELQSAAMLMALLSGRLTEAAARCGQGADAALRLHNYREAVRLRANQLLVLLIGPAEPPAEIDGVAAALRSVEAEAWERTGHAFVKPGCSLTGVYQFFRGDWQGARRNVVEAAAADPSAFGTSLLWYAGRILVSSFDPAGARPFVEGVPPRCPNDPASALISWCWPTRCGRKSIWRWAKCGRPASGWRPPSGGRRCTPRLFTGRTCTWAGHDTTGTRAI
ncbi:MAG TPA: AAA family ATPase [Symbiobacteriaceae bacterium]|nr:AAA family ATPase [Symbiobacteriaceae bacterium]